MTRNIDTEAVVARLRQWLAEGKDVRLVTSRRAIDGFPMIEMWDDGAVEVVTASGLIREESAKPKATRPGLRQATVSSIATYAAARRLPDAAAGRGSDHLQDEERPLGRAVGRR